MKQTIGTGHIALVLSIILSYASIFPTTTSVAWADATTEVKTKTITVKTVAELMATEKSTKAGNVTVLIEDGVYEMPKGLWLTGKNVTYRSKSGKRDKVVLKGGFKASHIFWITSDNVTIKDLSLGEVKNHGIQIHSELDADKALISNVRFFDTKEQMLKGSGSKSDTYSDGCIVENCLFEFTKGSAYQYYTGGIDVHKGNGWIVRNNVFKGIQYPKGQLTEGAIHFWNNSKGTLIENNTITGCDRGIMLGLDNSPHDKGIIRKNTITTTRDVGIYLCNATNSLVEDNRVTLASDYKNAIEYRFDTKGTIIRGNTTNRAITSRNGGTAKVSDNKMVKDGTATQLNTPSTPPTSPASPSAESPAPRAARTFPDSSRRIVCFSDQLTVDMAPSAFSDAQLKFAATKFAGTQKISKSFSDKLRTYNPDFLVLHYRLGIWQSAVPYITDGEHWGNDLETVKKQEDWFMHAAKDPKVKVASPDDGKLLLDIGNSKLREYYLSSLQTQVEKGAYDGAFLDSSSPASLQYFLGDKYPEYAGTKVKTSGFIGTYETYMQTISNSMAKKGYPIFPNVGAQITSWDTTDYAKCTGAFSEGSLDWQRRYGASDFRLGMDNLLKLVNQDKYLICQTYLKDQEEYAWRMNILCNYLLIKGKHTYISYFADKPFEYYPEFDLDLGASLASAKKGIDDLKSGDLYVRPFEKGTVLVNPDLGKTFSYSLPSGRTAYLVSFEGGGDILKDGRMEGSLKKTPVTGSVMLKPVSSAIVVYE